MSRTNFRQADMERIIRAAGREGAAVQIDMRALVVTVIPAIHSPAPIDAGGRRVRILPPGNFAPDGKDNFDED